MAIAYCSIFFIRDKFILKLLIGLLETMEKLLNCRLTSDNDGLRKYGRSSDKDQDLLWDGLNSSITYPIGAYKII